MAEKKINSDRKFKYILFLMKLFFVVSFIIMLAFGYILGYSRASQIYRDAVLTSVSTAHNSVTDYSDLSVQYLNCLGELGMCKIKLEARSCNQTS